MPTISSKLSQVPFGHQHARAGMSLVEVIIAMACLITGVGVVIDSMATSKLVTDRSANMAIAYQEIQAQIEKIQMMPFVDLAQKFKGIGFTVPGLNPPPGLPCTGVVTNATNPNPYDTTTGPGNPNIFPNGATLLPLRFTVTWVDGQGQCKAEVLYCLSYRGI